MEVCNLYKLYDTQCAHCSAVMTRQLLPPILLHTLLITMQIVLWQTSPKYTLPNHTFLQYALVIINFSKTNATWIYIQTSHVLHTFTFM